MATAQRTESTALTVSSRKEVVALFGTEAARTTIAPFLPDGANLERIAATVWLAMKDNPALAKCTAESLILATAKIQQWGLEVGTTAYLVPYGPKCTPVASYIGLAELVIGSGAVRDVEAHIVYANEHFRMEQGLSPVLEHHIIATASERGEPIGAYVIFRIGVHRDRSHYMTAQEIDSIRQQYSKQWKSGPLPEWYMLKTVVRHGVKLLPKNPRLAAVFRRFDDIDVAETLDELPTPATVRALPGTPLPPRGTAGAAGQAMHGYDSTGDMERITPRAEIPDPMQEDFIDDRDLADEEEGR